MNLFILSKNPHKAAIFLCDQHIVKMITETAQILSTAIRLQGVNDDKLYQQVRMNKYISEWAASNRQRFIWTLEHLRSLVSEYIYRYEKSQNFAKARSLIPIFGSYISIFPKGKLEPFVKSTKGMYLDLPIVSCYRQYYIADKKFAKWNHKRKPPKWFNRI